MMVVRKMEELIEGNVVDFNLEGKNKVYFLKKTIEARANVFMAEQYSLVKTIKKYPQLRKVIEKIQKNNKIKMALLFGSYAKGLAKKSSDIDLYIETKNKELKKEVELIDSRINVKIGGFDKDNILVKEMIKDHVVLKGVDVYYQKNGFFN